MTTIPQPEGRASHPYHRPPQAPLPAHAQYLIGREAELQGLRDHLDEGVLIVSSTGGAGVGMTALARRLAAAVAENYPDGCLELNLRGIEALDGWQVTLPALHRRVLRTLEPQAEIPEEPKALRKRYFAVLEARHVLLVLDDVASPLQLRALLPRNGAHTIVTSQSDIASTFPHLHGVVLDGLEPAHAHDLLVEVAPDLAHVSRRQLKRIVDRVGGVPLALRMLAPVLAPAGELSPRRLLRALDTVERRMVALRGSPTPDTPVDIALETAYDHLDRELRPFFEALAIFPAPFTADAAAAIWGIAEDEAQARLEGLVRLALIDQWAGSAHFEMHQRVRRFAQELFLSQPERSVQLVARYVVHYLREVAQVSSRLSARALSAKDAVFDPYLLWEHLPAAWRRLNGEDPGWPRPTTTDQWIGDFPQHAHPLLKAVLSRGEYRAWLAKALGAAETLDDRHGIAWLLGAMGQVKAELGDYAIAAADFKRQAIVARGAGAYNLESEAWMQAGAAYRALNDTLEARACWETAMQRLRATGDPRVSHVRAWLAELDDAGGF